MRTVVTLPPCGPPQRVFAVVEVSRMSAMHFLHPRIEARARRTVRRRPAVCRG